MSKLLIGIVLWTVGIAVLIGLIVIPLGLANNYTCHRYGRMTNRQVRTAFPNACYVKTSHGWFTSEQIRDTP